MTHDEIKTVVQVMLIALSRIAARTRTPTDDLMVSILKSNEARLVEAATKALETKAQPPTEEQVVEALRGVGMQL
jgi:hypothetical protein